MPEMDEDEARQRAQEDGYVTCDECGHLLEDHDTEGCQAPVDGGCSCPTCLTQAQIGEIRKRYGLPATFDRRNTLGY